jgi:hypothetical protein
MRTLALLALAAACAAPAALAGAPPVGPLPKPKVTSVKTTRGALVSIALPKRAGYVWRVARALDGKVVREVTEGDVGPTVVLVFKAVGRGRTAIVVAETKGETPKAYRAVRYDLTVS